MWLGEINCFAFVETVFACGVWCVVSKNCVSDTCVMSSRDSFQDIIGVPYMGGPRSAVCALVSIQKNSFNAIYRTFLLLRRKDARTVVLVRANYVGYKHACFLLKSKGFRNLIVPCATSQVRV